jgi:hypothetical protein
MRNNEITMLDTATNLDEDTANMSPDDWEEQLVLKSTKGAGLNIAPKTEDISEKKNQTPQLQKHQFQWG